MGRAPCCDKSGLKKGPWTPDEDKKLIDYIMKHGHGSWRTLPKNAGLSRCGKSCRLRWTNYLRPDIKRGRFSFEEEEIIIQLHSVMGNKWSAIAARLPGRTDNEIKNYWNTHVRKRLLRMGIDPVTHAPRLDLLDISSLLSSSIYTPAQLNLSKLLGIQPYLNPEALRMASNLLSSHHGHNQDYLLQQDLISNSQLQNSIQSFQTNQLQALTQDLNPTCTTSNTQIPSAAELVQTNVDQFPFNVFDINSQDTRASTCHETTLVQPNFNQTYAPELNSDYHNSNQPLNHDQLINTHFSSLLSAAGSCSAPLNMSGGNYINNSTSGTPLNSSTTYVNSGNEEEGDSYCSNFFSFDIPQLLNVNM